jgi:hypothetical protein
MSELVYRDLCDHGSLNCVVESSDDGITWRLCPGGAERVLDPDEVLEHAGVLSGITGCCMRNGASHAEGCWRKWRRLLREALLRRGWKERIEMSDPQPIDLCLELRRVLGLFDGAMPISPKEAWEEALDHVRYLRSVAPSPTAADPIGSNAKVWAYVPYSRELWDDWPEA